VGANRSRTEAGQALTRMLNESRDATRKLRALWTLRAIGGLSEEMELRLLKDSNEFVRAWAIQLLAEGRSGTAPVMQEFVHLAKADPSPVVRLYLAAAMQRFPAAKRENVIEELIMHGEDAEDHNLPLMYWYALEPLVGESPAKAAELIKKTPIPVLRQFMTRRVTAGRAL